MFEKISKNLASTFARTAVGSVVGVALFAALLDLGLKIGLAWPLVTLALIALTSAVMLGLWIEEQFTAPRPARGEEQGAPLLRQGGPTAPRAVGQTAAVSAGLLAVIAIGAMQAPPGASGAALNSAEPLRDTFYFVSVMALLTTMIIAALGAGTRAVFMIGAIAVIVAAAGLWVDLSIAG